MIYALITLCAIVAALLWHIAALRANCKVLTARVAMYRNAYDERGVTIRNLQDSLTAAHGRERKMSKDLLDLSAQLAALTLPAETYDSILKLELDSKAYLDEGGGVTPEPYNPVTPLTIDREKFMEA